MSQDQVASTASGELQLYGLDGTNPLGFLAALGTLALLAEADRTASVTLAWQASDCLWVPLIRGRGGDKSAAARTLAKQLRCPFKPDEQKDRRRSETQEAHEAVKKELKDATERIKRSGLRGNERKAAEDKSVTPIRSRLERLRSEWLTALRESVPSLELSLGKHLSATCTELRDTLLAGLEGASAVDRAAIDLLAAFGSDACSQPETEQMQATPFCFITGSGHQYFLDTARQLQEQVDASRIEAALFSRVEPSDEKLSMRWNPQEDRRYAVMWSDPTASGNKAKTNWAINLLAYRGLQLVPSAPGTRGLRTTGWYFDSELAWRWPIWTQGLPLDVVRSLLSYPPLVAAAPRRDLLSAVGITAVFESCRVQVGNPPLHKLNFTPAYQVA